MTPAMFKNLAQYLHADLGGKTPAIRQRVLNLLTEWNQKNTAVRWENFIFLLEICPTLSRAIAHENADKFAEFRDILQTGQIQSGDLIGDIRRIIKTDPKIFPSSVPGHPVVIKIESLTRELESTLHWD